jgi:hypothetical protein
VDDSSVASHPCDSIVMPTIKETGMARGDVHVVPDPKGKGWKVTREGQKRAVAKTDTQAAADQRGRQVAKNSKVEYNLHGKDGRVREKDSYGNDPRRTKG